MVIVRTRPSRLPWPVLLIWLSGLAGRDAKGLAHGIADSGVPGGKASWSVAVMARDYRGSMLPQPPAMVLSSWRVKEVIA